MCHATGDFNPYSAIQVNTTYADNLSTPIFTGLYVCGNVYNRFSLFQKY